MTTSSTSSPSPSNISSTILKEDLPADYYRLNFIKLLTHVKSIYQDLLKEEELRFFNAFEALSEDAQKLYVRMLTRKGQLFREDKLQYDEIGDTATCTEELQKAGLLSVLSNHSINDVFSLFTKSEWLDLLAQENIVPPKSLKKSDLEGIIENTFASRLPKFSTHIFQLLSEEMFTTFRLLFFGNLYASLTDFLLTDLGLITYEAYVINSSNRFFQSRRNIDAHLDYYETTENLENVLQQNAKDILVFFDSLPQKIEGDSALDRRLNRTFYALGRQLERLGDFDSAIAVYNHANNSECRERIARLLEKQNNIDACISLCKQLRDNAQNDEEYYFASQFGYRIAKKHGLDFPKDSTYTPTQRSITLNRIENTNVEFVANDYFNQTSTSFYCENSLFCTVFSLVYWDVIFAPTPSGFSHPFQSKPHDLYDSEFRSRRQSAFLKAEEIFNSTDAFFRHLQEKWQHKFGISCSLSYWQTTPWELIESAVTHIPLDHWKAIFSRLWSDLKNNRNGFPDLIVFHESRYTLVEIKGPGDRLQKNQQRWMHYFHKHNIPHEVVHIEWR